MPDTTLRARLAAAALLAAPMLGLVSVLFDLTGSRNQQMGTLWLAMAAWIPAMLCLEHFLKKVGDRMGALANGLGLVGALLRTNVVSAKWALGEGTRGSDSWLSLAEWSSTILMVAALALFGIGYLRHRLTPTWVSLGLVLSGLAWALTVSGGPRPVLWVGGHLVAVPALWIGGRLWRSPSLWDQPYLVVGRECSVLSAKR